MPGRRTNEHLAVSETVAKISKTVDGGNVVREFESLPLRLDVAEAAALRRFCLEQTVLMRDGTFGVLLARAPNIRVWR